jgi:formylglycine-generating enzyme required for sulfatase activity
VYAGSIFALNFLALISHGVAIAAPMSQIPDGAYRPLYLEPDKSKSDLPAAKKLKWGKKIPVKAFFIDPYPVTRKEFKEFLDRNPKWRRSQIKQIFADSSYLNDWVSDLDMGNEQDLESPVRYVSWFSARAYCRDQRKRLPSLLLQGRLLSFRKSP